MEREGNREKWIDRVGEVEREIGERERRKRNERMEKKRKDMKREGRERTETDEKIYFPPRSEPQANHTGTFPARSTQCDSGGGWG